GLLRELAQSCFDRLLTGTDAALRHLPDGWSFGRQPFRPAAADPDPAIPVQQNDPDTAPDRQLAALPVIGGPARPLSCLLLGGGAHLRAAIEGSDERCEDGDHLSVDIQLE